MARIEWVRLRLNNWVLWRLRELAGSSGYATQSVLLVERVDCDNRNSDINATIDDIDAAKTNQGVESLKVSHPVAYAVLQVYYLGKGEESPRATARIMGKSESTIYAQLEQADHALRVWFDANNPNKPKEKTFTT